MKNKITYRLCSYFVFILFMFSVIIGIVFMVLYRRSIIDLHRTELVQRAQNIATTVGNFEANRGNVGMGMGGYGAYLRFVGDIAMSNVWIIDSERNILTSGNGRNQNAGSIQYADLPAEVEPIIDKAFLNETVFSEDFSGFLKELTLTVAVPVLSEKNEVMGIVLLHSPVEVGEHNALHGFYLLCMSILIAMVCVLGLTIRFSYHFTNPLHEMNQMAIKLAKGDYEVKSNIMQEDEIGELAKTMDILAQRLLQASEQNNRLEEMRKELIANISHELKTPVTVMRGSLEALVDKVVTDPDMIENYHKQMLKESIFLQRLVGDLLDLTRLQNVEFTLEQSMVCIEEIVEDVIRTARQMASMKNVSFVVEKEETIPLFLGDYGRLRQMILIILDNAIKFSKENGVIEMKLKKDMIQISDYGEGIKEEDINHIFERFYRSSTEEKKEGTGLGLAIAKQIAQRHGMSIQVKSVKNVKTTFTIHFSVHENVV